MRSLSSKTMRTVLYNTKNPWFFYVNDTLALITILSVAAVVLESVDSFSSYAPWFALFEYVTVSIFALEYIARIIAHAKKPQVYVFSFLGIIDLLSIVPTFIGIGNLSFLKTVRVLRILRLLRIIKVAHLRHMSGDPENKQSAQRLMLGIYFFALLSATVIFGALIYALEGAHVPYFANIPLGMLWTAKVIMGGVAQHMPTTIGGEIATIAARFTGLALFGLLISLIGSKMRKLLFGSVR